MNRNYTLSRLVAIFALVLACCCSSDVKATGCYNNAGNGWSVNSPTQMGTPPCGSTGTLCVSSTAYTYFNSTAGATYTFTASAGSCGGGWGSYWLTWYQYNGSAWVVAYAGQNSISGVAGFNETPQVIAWE